MLTFRSYTCKVGPSDAEAPSSIFCALYFPPSLYPSLCRSMYLLMLPLSYLRSSLWQIVMLLPSFLHAVDPATHKAALII